MNDRPRYVEDYLVGSSDRPKTVHSPMTSGKSTLEMTIDGMPAPIRHNDVIDIKATNQATLRYAKSNRLLPVISREGIILYRIIELDGDGVLNIRYQQEMPEQLQAIDPHEFISITVAAQLLKMATNELWRLFNSQGYRMKGSHVYLADVNVLQGLSVKKK